METASLQGETDKEIIPNRGEELFLSLKHHVYKLVLPFGSNHDQNNSASGCTFENTHRDPVHTSARRQRGEPHIAWRFSSRGIHKPQTSWCSLTPLSLMFKMYQILFQVLHLSRKDGLAFLGGFVLKRLSCGSACSPRSFVGLSSRKNANPFIFMQIFAADLRGQGEVCVFKKTFLKYQISNYSQLHLLARQKR